MLGKNGVLVLASASPAATARSRSRPTRSTRASCSATRSWSARVNASPDDFARGVDDLVKAEALLPRLARAAAHDAGRGPRELRADDPRADRERATRSRSTWRSRRVRRVLERRRRRRRERLMELHFTNLLIVVAAGSRRRSRSGFFPRLRLPSIVFELLLGIILGPARCSAGSSVDEPVAVMSLIGLAVLLFLAGLEIEFDKLRGQGPARRRCSASSCRSASRSSLGLILQAGRAWSSSRSSSRCCSARPRWACSCRCSRTPGRSTRRSASS